MQTWKTLCRFGPGRPTLRVTGSTETRVQPTNYLQAVDAHWSTLKRQFPDRVMFDGPLLDVVGVRLNDSPVLYVAHCGYRHWMYSSGRHEALKTKYGADVGCRPLAVATAVITSDRQLVITTRGDRVAECPGRIHVPAGHLDPVRDQLDDGYSPELAVRGELHEELGVTTQQIAAIDCLELSQSLVNGKPELLFQTRLNITANQLRQNAANADDRFEISQLYYVEYTVPSLREWLKQHAGDITAPAAALFARLLDDLSGEVKQNK